MLGANISTVSWPKCGEIDMMEYLGHQTSTVYGTLHWDDNGHKYLGGNKTLSSGAFSDGFHIFTLVWTPSRFRWLVDGVQYYELDKNEVARFPFDLPEFFIFNVAVGGNWPGNPDGTTVFPQHMIVDYVRVYQ
jgi:beta-glucanase (GH16 family)